MAGNDELTVELERALLKALRETYAHLNGTYFDWSLKPPVFRLTDASQTLGSWVSATRGLELSRRLFVEHGWGITVEVLKHEMAHQYVDEVLSIVDQSAHGPAFRDVCRRRGIDARAVGLPGATGSAELPILDKITKLLALAESAEVHEAEAAMAAARRLMLKHNIESVTETTNYVFRHVGQPTGRTPEHVRVLAMILDQHFFVEAVFVPVWRPLEGKRGSVLEVCGALENVELAEYVYAFLCRTGERLWKSYRVENNVRSNRERRTFLAGVMFGFMSKLDRETKRQASKGLVWAGDPKLRDFWRGRHPHVRTMRTTGNRRTAARDHGRAAGEQIVLHRGISRGSSGGRPKQLK